VLQVNIKGCGCKDKKETIYDSEFLLNVFFPSFYTSFPDPPSVRCKNFTDTFGYEGK
jgi:hypothetical protein